MRYPGTIADMTKHYEIINNILNGRGIVKTDSSLEEKALNVVIELLDSKVPELRLQAAEIILKR